MIEKQGKKLNLKNVSVSVQDPDPNSKFFVITEFSDIFTSGKNVIGFNGSNYLKPNSSILVEALDVLGNPLYTEIAQTSNAVLYRDGVSIIVSIYVYSDTPVGVGEVILVGTLKTGQKVRWQRNININSRLPNTSKTRFYDVPSIEAKSVLSDIFVYTSVSETTANGQASSLAIEPAVNSNFLLFDVNRKQVDYQIQRLSGDPFLSQMEGFDIVLSDINNTTASFTATISEVSSNDILKVSAPYTIDSNFSKIVSTFSFSNYQIVYVPRQTGYIVRSVGTGSDGQEIKYKQSLAEITIGNLKTFSGNPYRFRLYRKSLNTNFDSECIADELLQSKEVIIDEGNPNRMEENIGYFYDANHITKYWLTNSPTITTTLSNVPFIDAMYIQESPVQPSDRIENRNYVIAKDYTVTSSRDSSYVAFDSVQDASGSGTAHDSNFIKLYKNVGYIFSANVLGNNNNFPSSCGILFYLTSSLFSYSTSPLFDGRRIPLLDIKQTDAEKNHGLVETVFTLNEDTAGTIVVSPYGGDFIISKVSIKPSQAFSFSPEILNIKVPFPVDVANARYLIKSELFDANSNLIPVKLETTQFFDKYGESLTKISASFALDLSGIPAGVFTFDYNNPHVNSIRVDSFAQITGSLTVGGPAHLTADRAISSSYADFALDALRSISASYAPSSPSISSSYASTALFAFTASYLLNAPSSISSSHADTASYAFSSVSASYAPTPVSVSFASSALSASYAPSAATSSQAVTSSYSFTSVSASWAPVPATASYALFSISSSYSETSSYSLSSVSASYAPVPVTSSYSLTASYVELANTSSLSITASFSLSSLSSSHSETSSYSLSSVSASYAITSSPSSLIIQHPFICTVKTIFDGMKFPKNINLIGYDVYCAVAPLGSDLIIRTLKDGADTDTLTLTAGNTFSSSSLASSFTPFDRFGLRISQIGSDIDNPGDNLFVTIHYI